MVLPIEGVGDRRGGLWPAELRQQLCPAQVPDGPGGAAADTSKAGGQNGGEGTAGGVAGTGGTCEFVVPGLVALAPGTGTGGDGV